MQNMPALLDVQENLMLSTEKKKKLKVNVFDIQILGKIILSLN